MKLITNWSKATVADIEADALLGDATKIHVLSYHLTNDKQGSINGINSEGIKKFFNYHLENNLPIVMHNGICFDVPLVEKLLGMDLSKLMLVDTLPLSWYLNFDRKSHGLDSFFEDYGIAKPKITDWEGLTFEEYKHRCEEDVKINLALWEDLKARLRDIYFKVKQAVDSGQIKVKRMSSDEVCYIDQYVNSSSVDDYIDRILTFLMFKRDCSRLKEKTGWLVDVNYLDSTIDTLEDITNKAKEELEAVMPKVVKFSEKTRPKKPFKMNGQKSVSGLEWDRLEKLAKSGDVDEYGNLKAKMLNLDTIKVISKYEEPNINSGKQLKDFLFSKGWKPRTFKYEKDEEAFQVYVDSGFRKELKPKPRAIPQISVDGDDGKELCQSVLELADEVPEIMYYAKYTTVKHRLDMCKGFRSTMTSGNRLHARCGGFTNTLREKHRELVNLPKPSKPYGNRVRGSLIADNGCVLLGSDMSSLEDRVKVHFMFPYDYEYAQKLIVKGYDPHLDLACSAELLQQWQVDRYKELKKKEDKTQEEQLEFSKLDKIRAAGKIGNYGCQYGSGADTLSLNADIPLDIAKKVVEGYKKLNWSIKTIADDQCVIVDDRGDKWLVNPINGFAYSLRSDKDRFSTLCQGTGSFFFDVWVDKILEKMYSKFKVKRLTGQFHDEYITCFKDTESNKLIMEEITRESISEINKEYLLRRPLDCDVAFGYRYSEIH